MKAAQIIEPNKPLKISEIDTPTPTGNQVVVKVKAVGVCHSDLHLWEGGYDTGDGFMKVTDRGVKFLSFLVMKLLEQYQRLEILSKESV